MLIRSFIIDPQDIREMVKMARYISYIKYVVFINLALFISIITIYSSEIKRLKKHLRDAAEENKSLKAEFYDINKKSQA